MSTTWKRGVTPGRANAAPPQPAHAPPAKPLPATPVSVTVGILQANTAGDRFQSLDNDARVDLVGRAVQALEARRVQDGSELGVLAAPEYMFSKQNANQKIALAGAGKYYSRGITEQQKEDNLVRFQEWSDQYKRLILIPGTMAWLKPFDREKGIQRHRRANKGNPGKTRELRLVKALNATTTAGESATKRFGQTGGYVGGNDYGNRPVPTSDEKESSIFDSIMEDIMILRNSLYVAFDGDILHKYNKIGDYHEVLNYEDQPSVFVPGDVGRRTATLFEKLFGFEICLDHAYDMLGFQKDDPLAGGTPVDMHILLSASVGTERTRLKTGGVFIHASSDAGESGVWKKRSTGVVEPVAEDKPHALSFREKMRFFQTDFAMDRKYLL